MAPDSDILIGFSGIFPENILLANQFLEPAHTQFHVSEHDSDLIA